MSEFLRKLRGNKGTIPDFPGGTADKNPPANARDILSLVWEDSTCHGGAKPCTTATEPLLCNKRSCCSLQLEKALEKQQRPSTAKNK